MSENISALQKARAAYSPKLPEVFKSEFAVEMGETILPVEEHQKEIQMLFPHTYAKPLASLVPGKGNLNANPVTVGVVLSGGPAPGGHNAIAGLFDALRKANPKNRLIGFLKGPKGVFTGKYKELTPELVDQYRNTGGFDMIGSGRDKIETPEQLDGCEKTLKDLGASALVVIGGDDSNTNAAILAEHFLARQLPVQVIGLPKTIDGDMRNEFIDASFGFDSACKVYSELVGNICRDAMSGLKYYHFVKLMGRAASHVALEVALQTHPNCTVVSEELHEKKMTLAQVVDDIADVVVRRADAGKNYGVVIIPEGIMEFLDDFKATLKDIAHILGQYEVEFKDVTDIRKRVDILKGKLQKDSVAVYEKLPESVQVILTFRDPHGNLMVSQIESEKVVVAAVDKKLMELAKAGTFKGKFSALTHFFGYEGRCVQPSNFDADYCYTLGFTAAQLIRASLTGYTVSARKLAGPAAKWEMGGVPVTSMLTLEARKGALKPVIRKALVETDGAPFKAFAAVREDWKSKDAYRLPGPIQYFGPSEVCDATTITLQLESAAK
jgi:pyrophosphate--fructose-6-phosphate 1-phosphotransferase